MPKTCSQLAVPVVAIIIFATSPFVAFAQITIKGIVLDYKSQKPLADVSIGFKGKSRGTASLEDGSFKLDIPSEHGNDTLIFSMLGYSDLRLAIAGINSSGNLTIQMHEKITQLNEVIVSDERLVEKKYGIKHRSPIHFTDGIFKNNTNFEIGQVIRLGKVGARLNSVNLHVNSFREDSATFKIHFYRYNEDENQPIEKLVENEIIQRHRIEKGWLKFDLKQHSLFLRGNVFVAIEFIPEPKQDIKQIIYEIRIGGSSKSFFRGNGTGKWITPPHHFCLYVTAFADKSSPDDLDDVETIPTITIQSAIAKERYSIFVRLPKNYRRNGKTIYPVVYHLDGNAFFDAVSSSVDLLKKKKKLTIDPIVVGIGYSNAYVMDSLRDRDYTYPVALPADSFKISGNAELFYQFIKRELKPYIERTYRTDTTNRTIMGHSLGGYFVLYSMLHDTSGTRLCNGYVAASPYISYCNNYLLTQFQKSAFHEKGHEKLKLYMTIGEIEMAENPDNNFQQFVEILSKQKIIDLKSVIYKNQEHMGTAMPSFEDGIEFILQRH